MPRDVGVVVVAAGQGVRLGGAVPKQFLEIAGVPILLRSLRPFTAHPEVAHTVVVLSAEQARTPPAWLADLRGDSLTLVAGGAERSESAMAGVAALNAACSVVLIHDAARPFADRAMIDRVIAEARAGKGAVPAVPVGDTLKFSAGGELVERTVSRQHLYRAQTPQGFPRSLLEAAYRESRGRGQGATDDAALVESIGQPVALVAGSEWNLKITTPADLKLAEWLAREESR